MNSLSNGHRLKVHWELGIGNWDLSLKLILSRQNADACRLKRGPDSVCTKSSTPSARVTWGEVQSRADIRLDCTVAIKVLTGALAADSELRQRFEQEARRLLHR